VTFHLDTIPLHSNTNANTHTMNTLDLAMRQAPAWAAAATAPSAVPAAFGFVAAHLLSLPGVAMALFLYAVGRVAASGGWLQGFFELLFSGFVLLPVVLLCALLLLVAGLFASVRPWACVALVAINLAVVGVSWTLSPPAKMQDLLVWVPAALSCLFALVLAWRGFVK
jgi:hypothetical protein